MLLCRCCFICSENVLVRDTGTQPTPASSSSFNVLYDWHLIRLVLLCWLTTSIINFLVNECLLAVSIGLPVLAMAEIFSCHH